MKARVIAFYLPQFHPVKENDEMWGKGFTEWTNVAKAKPLYKGHYQPQIPADLGFYDLRIPEVREAQAEMAKECGIEGFCYWHYWFGNGKRILERPFDEVLKFKKPNFPFCLGWANHSWSNKTWQKSKHFTKEITFIEQLYPGEKDYEEHFYNVLPAFKDKRYIKVDGKPLFLIFDPEAIPDVEEFIKLWRKLAKENGLKDMYFVGRVTAIPKLKDVKISKFKNLLNEISIENRYSKILERGFDAINSDTQNYAEIKTSGIFKRICRGIVRKYIGNITILKYDYSKIMENIFIEEEKKENIFPQLIPRLDRTPRSGKDARIYADSTPEKFRKVIKRALKLVENKREKIIFLQAWNEWGEGNYMEPDLKYGKGYLNVLKEELFMDENNG